MPSLILPVSPGDKIDIDVWAYYEAASNYNNLIDQGPMINAIASAFGGVSGAPGDPGTIWNNVQSGFPGTLGTTGSGTLPAAFLTYVLYDQNFNKITAGWQGVTANGNTALEHLIQPQITIEQPGYIYVIVYNRSNSASWVYFDDLKVVQTHSTVVAASDYYPFGLVMDGRQVTDVSYRYGYQGQYAEKDNTTGWNEFDLRMYDARFGRWISPDPYGQFHSPYLAMGNIPNLTIDQDGGFSFNWQSAFIGAGVGTLVMTGVGYATGARGSELQGWALAGAGLGFVGGGVGGELISGLGNIGGGDGLRMKIKGPGPGLIGGAAQVGSKVVQSKKPLSETAKKMVPKAIPNDMVAKIKEGTNWILDEDEKFTRENAPGYTDVEDESDPNSKINVYIHPSVLKAGYSYWEYVIGHEWIHVTHVRSSAFSTWLKAYRRSKAIAISEYKAWTWSYHKDPNNDFLTFPQKQMAKYLDQARPYKPTLGTYF